DLLDEARDLGERPDEVVVGVPGRGGSAEAGHLLHERVDRALALEALLVAPGGGEVAPLDELPRRGPRRRAGTLGAGAPAEDAAHRLAGIRERLLEPAVEGAVEEALGHVPGRHPEERVDARLDRPLAEQVGAERVDRADARLLERAERVVERLGGPRASRLLDRLPEPELQLAGRGIGEGDRHHLVEPGAAGGQERDHAGHQLGRLPRPRGRLDHERRAEVVADAIARLLVGEVRHGSLRRRSSAYSTGGTTVPPTTTTPVLGRVFPVLWSVARSTPGGRRSTRSTDPRSRRSPITGTGSGTLAGSACGRSRSASPKDSSKRH